MLFEKLQVCSINYGALELLEAFSHSKLVEPEEKKKLWRQESCVQAH